MPKEGPSPKGPKAKGGLKHLTGASSTNEDNFLRKKKTRVQVQKKIISYANNYIEELLLTGPQTTRKQQNSFLNTQGWFDNIHDNSIIFMIITRVITNYLNFKTIQSREFEESVCRKMG